MPSRYKSLLIAIIFSILITPNAFSGKIYIEGQFTFPPPKTKIPENIEIRLPNENETITIANFNIQLVCKSKAGSGLCY